MSWFPLAVNVGFSVGAYFLCKRLIPCLTEMFIDARLAGKDLGKKDKPQMCELFKFYLIYYDYIAKMNIHFHFAAPNQWDWSPVAFSWC